ncbi:MAG: radical SAM protein [Candidatus Moranbacteria bacterium]|nr:radical SAM protein [Candidatus Moranbacteria bacterium]
MENRKYKENAKGSFEKYNSQKESFFTSTGEKIFFHKDAINDLRNKCNHPIVLHIMPTEICNLRCVFCSVAERGEDGRLFPDLEMSQIRKVVGNFKKMGLKAVILSGGGEPTIYPRINELLEFLHKEKLEIGLITNGVALAKKIKPKNLNYLAWIRISINSLDYLGDIQIPKLNPKKTTLGFSYIWNPLTSKKTIKKIQNKIEELSSRSRVEYVRLLPDCNLETEELEKAHKKLREMTKKLGLPFFHQYKTHITPFECHLGRVHPVLYTDGYIYPCDSLVLNSPVGDKKFHQSYALCRWDEVNKYFTGKIRGTLIDTKKCPHCVFSRQNKLLFEIINADCAFPEIDRKFKHVNFI